MVFGNSREHRVAEVLLDSMVSFHPSMQMPGYGGEIAPRRRISNGRFNRRQL